MALNPSPISPTQRFWRLLKPDQKDIRNVYVYSIFNGLIGLSLPLGIQVIVNLIQGGQISTSWIVLLCLVVLGVAITGVLQVFQLRITENLQQKIFTRAAFEFAYRIPQIRMESLYKHYAPELMNRFFDTMSVQKGLSKILIDFLTALLHVVFGLMLLSLYHPFFIIFSFLLVVVVYAIFRFTARRGLETSLYESKYKYQVAHWLEELARTSITFKLAGRTDLALQRVDGHVGKYLSARENHFKVLIRQYSMMVGFKVLVVVGLLAIGGILVMEQQMNIGQFVAAEVIILLIISAVEKLVVSLETIYDVLTSLEKIGQVTDLELEQNQGVNLEVLCQNIGLNLELDQVSFTYPGKDKKILDGVSLSIPCGEKVVVIGENGAGKSTLLHILAGLYDVQEGTISYNGLPKGNLDLISLRNVIGNSLTQEQLFEGTVLENITMGREKADFAHVKEITDQLGLATFIRQLPDGYDTVIDPQGSKFPRSTIQKLLLARSIAARPELLLLEDAFQHIDRNERKDIIDYVVSPIHPWTLIAVSSDPYLAQAAQKVAVMQAGKIISYTDPDNLEFPSYS